MSALNPLPPNAAMACYMARRSSTEGAIANRPLSLLVSLGTRLQGAAYNHPNKIIRYSIWDPHRNIGAWSRIIHPRDHSCPRST